MGAPNGGGEVREEDLTVTASDGVPLAMRLIRPEEPRAAVLLSPATGLAKEFYRNFCTFLAEQGIATLTYDYRGTGGSTPDDLGAFHADLPDWGRLDMAAALDRLVEEVGPDVPVVHIANSAGGHVTGFLPTHELVRRHILVSVGFGTWWTHRFPGQQAQDLFFWWLYGPYHLLRRGYIPAGGLWGGTTLPKGVFRTWRRWSHKGDYFRRELADRLKPHSFDDITAPIVSVAFTDDPLTKPAAAEAFLGFFTRAATSLRVLSPSDLGVESLKHQDIYRRRNKAAWPTLLDLVLDGL